MDRLRKLVRENVGWLILVIIVGGAFLFLRTPGDEVASEEEFTAILSGGKPVLVELFSNT
jgi:hypothetical protein